MKKEDILNFIEKNRKLYKKHELENIICSKFSIKSYEFDSIYNFMINQGLILTTKKGQVISARKNKIYKFKLFTYFFLFVLLPDVIGIGFDGRLINANNACCSLLSLLVLVPVIFF